MEVEDHTHRCHIERDTPGPANMGNRMSFLDPTQTDLGPRFLVDAGERWIGCAMSMTHDGTTLYFCMAPEGGGFLHIYLVSTLFTMTSEGEDIRPITFHVVNDRERRVRSQGKLSDIHLFTYDKEQQGKVYLDLHGRTTRQE